jgi:transcriptional regulator with XRE-family HTH domain
MRETTESIRLLRALGIKQNKLASVVGLTPEYFSLIANGKRESGVMLKVVLHLLVLSGRARKAVGL